MANIIKGVIGAQDFHQSDGTTTRTFTRTTSTGATLTLTDPFSEVDALVAFGGGSRLDDVTLLAALTAIGTTNPMTLRLRPGTWTVKTARDWSAYTNVILKLDPGAVLQMWGVALTWGGQIQADLTQHFDYVDDEGYQPADPLYDGTPGSITPSSLVSAPHPHWWDGGVTEFISLADDATPSVQKGTKFLSGGITTITDFDDGVEGQVITLIAAHSITITDGTNIFLSGSANFVMSATDTLSLIQKADRKWYEISRSDNT